jgi:hypothetical protein
MRRTFDLVGLTPPKAVVKMSFYILFEAVLEFINQSLKSNNKKYINYRVRRREYRVFKYWKQFFTQYNL